jgi:DNA-binding PadR family transcriptional regulator
MGVKEGLLALLADEPKHGYQLKLDLETATGSGVSVNIGQVYSTLQRLERDGLVEATDDGDASRIVYAISTSGRAALKQWGDRPESLAAGRDELSIKILLAIYTGSLDPIQVVATQRRETMGVLQDYTRLRSSDDSGDIAWQLHLDRLIYNAEAELKWLDRVEERLPEPAPVLSTASEDEPMIEEVV